MFALIFAFATLLADAIPTPAPQPAAPDPVPLQSVERKMTVDGIERTYFVYRPAKLPAGAHPPLAAGEHQLSIAVPNWALRSRPEIAAVTARASGAVSEVGLVPAEEAIIAACSTADTSADVCTAQSPASSAAMRQNRKRGSTTANSTSA